MTTLEILPAADDIDHTDGPDCICGPTITDATVIRHHALDPDAHEAPARRDRLARWRPTINLVFVLAFGFIWGATTQPSYEVTRWILIGVSTAYLAWTITSYIHTRRNQ